MQPRGHLVTLAVFFLLGAAHTMAQPHLLEADQVTSSSIRSWILEIESMPCGRVYADADPKFWQVVRLGLEHVPEILDLVDDPTETEVTVCLSGGQYAVGDIAVIAFGYIVQGVPVAAFASGGDQSRIDEIGFGVYWHFVRASPDNREAMEAFLSEWFEQNLFRLVWTRVEESPAGGHYEVHRTIDPEVRNR